MVYFHEPSFSRRKCSICGSDSFSDVATDKEEVSRYEWLAAALGALVFIGLVGYFGREALREDSDAPDIAVQVDSISRASAGWIAHLKATNSGGAATSVRIVVSINTTYPTSITPASPRNR